MWVSVADVHPMQVEGWERMQQAREEEVVMDSKMQKDFRWGEVKCVMELQWETPEGWWQKKGQKGEQEHSVGSLHVPRRHHKATVSTSNTSKISMKTNRLLWPSPCRHTQI